MTNSNSQEVGRGITNLLFASAEDCFDLLAKRAALLIVRCDNLWLAQRDSASREKIASADSLARKALQAVSDEVKHYDFLQPAPCSSPDERDGMPVNSTADHAVIARVESLLAEAEALVADFPQSGIEDGRESPYSGTSFKAAFGLLFGSLGQPKEVPHEEDLHKKVLVITDGEVAIDPAVFRRLLGIKEGVPDMVIVGDFNTGGKAAHPNAEQAVAFDPNAFWDGIFKAGDGASKPGDDDIFQHELAGRHRNYLGHPDRHGLHGFGHERFGLNDFDGHRRFGDFGERESFGDSYELLVAAMKEAGLVFDGTGPVSHEKAHGEIFGDAGETGTTGETVQPGETGIADDTKPGSDKK